MLKYLIILLDDISTSYCHYSNNKNESKLISLETLKKGVLFAMKNDVRIQYVYPLKALPIDYVEIINSMFHDNIGPHEQQDNMDIVIINDFDKLEQNIDFLNIEKKYVLRTTINDFLDKYSILKTVLEKNLSINVVFTDVEKFTDDMIAKYQEVLYDLGACLKDLIYKGNIVNTNLITDRIALNSTNNCGAGDTCITLAPNGNFYPCPAYYYDEIPFGVIGNIESGLDIKNQKLFTIDGAPLCKICDAFHCKRCAWLNKKLTYEVNVPSRQQCVMAHIERNTSKKVLDDFHKMNILTDKDISEIDYIDPFEKYQSL